MEINEKGGNRTKESEIKSNLPMEARKRNYAVLGVEGLSIEDLAENINLELENCSGWIREIRPVAWVTSAANIDGSEVTAYDNQFGALIIYEPLAKEDQYIPPNCAVCGASEDDRRGQWIHGKFYCNECIKKRFEE